MHFALPPRKSPHSPSYTARSSRLQAIIRHGTRPMVLLAVGTILALFLLYQRWSGPQVAKIPPGTPPVVIVTALDATTTSDAYVRLIKDNRRQYAQKHGYTYFFPNIDNYNLQDPPCPKSWAKVPAMRHAMTLYPHTTFFWYLDQSAVIVNASLSVTAHVTAPQRLASLMLTDVPVVPPDSVIKTFPLRPSAHIDLILTQDRHGLCQNSFIVRRGDWARFFLDSWFDPLYRSYNFQKLEGHALEHLVQWHSTVLTRLALVPQRVLNAYTRGEGQELYHEGDFVANLRGCDADAVRSCESEALPFLAHFEKTILEGA